MTLDKNVQIKNFKALLFAWSRSRTIYAWETYVASNIRFNNNWILVRFWMLTFRALPLPPWMKYSCYQDSFDIQSKKLIFSLWFRKAVNSTCFPDLRDVWPCVFRLKIHMLINILLNSNTKNTEKTVYKKQCTLTIDIWCTTDNGPRCPWCRKKCPVMLACPLGVVIVDDELIWGHVLQTVLLQGKVPGDWSGRFRATLLLTSRSSRVLARLKASVVVYWRYCWSCCPREGSGSSLRWFSRQPGSWDGKWCQLALYH